MNRQLRVIISGGGTAGHIYPALSVAEHLRAMGHHVLFVGAQGKMEMERVPAAGFEIVGLPVAGLQRRLTLKNLVVPFKLAHSLAKARKIINDFQPDVVAGFGGYASAPILKAAQRVGIPTLIQEQNSFAGLTNRMLAKKANAICTAYEGMERFFEQDKIFFTGNPLRVNPVLGDDRVSAYARFGLSPDCQTLLITGGSLGTRTLNEAVLAQLERGGFGDGVQVVWQCGKFYLEEFTERAREYGVTPVAFIESMADAYAVADVVVCRAGASTVSELQVLGKAAIFVPSPNVAEDHQTKNARSMVECGAALMVKDAQAKDELFRVAFELLSQPAQIEQMEQRMREMAKPNAAQDVAQIVVGLAR